MRDVAVSVARWLVTTTSSEGTRRSYIEGLGLHWLLAACGQGPRIAAEVQRRWGVRLPVRAPRSIARTWHMAWLPWCWSRGVHPWSSEVCALLPVWGQQWAASARPSADHLWPADTGRPRPLAESTVRSRAAIVRSYYQWCYAAGLLPCAPADLWRPAASGIRPADAWAPVDDDLDLEDVQRLQIAADRHPGRAGRRELAAVVVALLAATGARRAELTGLDVTDVDLGTRRGPRVRLTRKGGRRQWVPLDDAAVARLDAWMGWRDDVVPDAATGRARLLRAQKLPHPVPVLVRTSGPRGAAERARVEVEGHAPRLSSQAIYELLKAVVERSGDETLEAIEGRLRPHAIRSAVATHLIDEDTPLHEVATLLGHASLTTTARYDRRRTRRHLGPVARMHQTAGQRYAELLAEATARGA